MNIIMRNGQEFDYSLWYYLAGPMTGCPEYNYPAFEKAKAQLEEQGVKVRSPHEADHGQHEYKMGYSGRSCVAMVHEWDSRGIPYGADCGKPFDDPIHRQGRGALPREVYMKAGYRMLLSCEGIILLKGWTESRGAREELFVARSLRYPVFNLGDDFLMQLPNGVDH